MNDEEWTNWEIGEPVVPECINCGAPDDVQCDDDCENKDFRNAMFDEGEVDE